jgi:hypothetical protein
MRVSSEIIDKVTLAVEKTRSDLINSLKPGQVVRAVSLSDNQQGQVQLRIGQQEISAQTGLQTRPGERLLLQVIHGGDLPELRLLQPASPSEPGEILKQALRQTLPRQVPLQQALQHLLDQGATTARETRDALPQATRQLLQQLGARLPEPAQLAAQPALIKQLVLQSGLFAEARIVQQGGLPVQDLKLELLSLLRNLRQQTEPATNGGDPAKVARPAATGENATPAPTAPAQRTAGDITPVKNLTLQLLRLFQGDARTSTTTASTPAADAPAKVRTEPAGAGQGIARTSVDAPSPRIPALPSSAQPLIFRPPPPLNLPLADRELSFQLLNELGLTLTRPRAQASTATATAAVDTLDQAVLRLLRDLTQSTEGAVARIRHNQLSSASPGDDGVRNQAWHLDLPFRVGSQVHNFQLRIEEEPTHKRRQGGRSWTSDLSFDFTPLGPVHCRVSVHDKQVSIIFWAQQDDTLQLISDNLEMLAARLRQAGLQARQLAAYPGAPPQPRTDTADAIRQLLDEQA